MSVTYDVRADDFDLYVYQGEDWKFSAVLDENGVLVDLSGYTGKMEVREAPGSPVLLTLATSGSGIVLDNSGQIALSMDHSQTAAFEISQAQYDLKIRETSSSSITPVFSGKLFIRRQITELT